MDAAVFNDGQSVEAWEKRHARERLKKYNGNGGGTPLAMAVRLPSWATPTVGDSRGGGNRNLPGSKSRFGISLTDQVQRGLSYELLRQRRDNHTGPLPERATGDPAEWGGERS